MILKIIQRLVVSVHAVVEPRAKRCVLVAGRGLNELADAHVHQAANAVTSSTCGTSEPEAPEQTDEPRSGSAGSRYTGPEPHKSGRKTQEAAQNLRSAEELQDCKTCKERGAPPVCRTVP